jgi:hypothetical protein
VIASSVQQGPGHREKIVKSNYFNVLQKATAARAGCVAGVFLPGGKNFPLKEGRVSLE